MEQFELREITQSVLNMSWFGAKTLGGFFQFGRYDRMFSNVTALGDCHIYSLCPVQRVVGWPTPPGPPDPSTFTAEFSHIISALLGRDLNLYLHVKAVERQFFDEVAVLEKTISPLGTPYMLLAPVNRKRLPGDAGNLIFESPLTLIDSVAVDWFRSPVVEVEGYIMKSEMFGRLAHYYFKPDSPETIRGVLSILRLGFRMWPDFNGMDLFSESLDEDEIRLLLHQYVMNR
jgi:hypothetical protein